MAPHKFVPHNPVPPGMTPGLHEQLQALGLQTIDEYLQWCDRHGFSRRTQKNWRQRLRERAYAQRAEADACLARRKTEVRRPESVLEHIFTGGMPEGSLAQPRWAAVYRAVQSTEDSRCAKSALRRLLLHLSRTTDLLSDDAVIPELGRQAGNTYVEAIAAAARFGRAWYRDPEDWKPQTHNARRQFASLVRHLFAEWPVPAFMDSVWFKGRTTEAERQQRWFLHLGRGENLRHADLPIPYTKKMAHFFLQAPSDFSVEAALRWGQIHALGGNERIARAVVGTRLESHFDHDEFWTSVLRWFIDQPLLDRAQFGPIIDYVHHQRFTPVETYVGAAARVGPPAQPNFTMKDREPNVLMRQVEGWHARLAHTAQPAAEWPRSGIAPFEFIEGSQRNGNLKVWTIRELLSSKALTVEGREMKHCVASYARSCAQGRSSIWTMQVDEAAGPRKVLTIEINLQARLICQARGRNNAAPGEKHRGLIRRWAEQMGLTVARYV